MSEFLLLFRNGWPPVPLPPTTARAAPPREQWQAWLDRRAAANQLAAPAHQLEAAGKVLQKGQAVAMGPYVEGEEALWAVLVVEAADYEAAIQLTVDCPVLAEGGTIEVRQIL